jgi:hypothetical protein
MDASDSYQVWNHLVYSYQYTYIDPKSREDFATLDKATVFSPTGVLIREKNIVLRERNQLWEYA